MNFDGLSDGDREKLALEIGLIPIADRAQELLDITPNIAYNGV
jgi:hypothetical protein